MQYQLNIMIDDWALQQMSTLGWTVTIVKTAASNPAESLPIGWITFQPIVENKVTWSDTDYAIFATEEPLQRGAAITMACEAPAQPGRTYTFQNGEFNEVAGNDSTITITNLQEGPFSFGLAQQAVVNNVNVTAPLNAVPLKLNQSASFVPGETVSIFVPGFEDNGTVLYENPPQALTFTLTPQDPVANVGFNDSNNEFYLQIEPPILSA